MDDKRALPKTFKTCCHQSNKNWSQSRLGLLTKNTSQRKKDNQWLCNTILMMNFSARNNGPACILPGVTVCMQAQPWCSRPSDSMHVDNQLFGIITKLPNRQCRKQDIFNHSNASKLQSQFNPISAFRVHLKIQFIWHKRGTALFPSSKAPKAWCTQATQRGRASEKLSIDSMGGRTHKAIFFSHPQKWTVVWQQTTAFHFLRASIHENAI